MPCSLLPIRLDPVSRYGAVPGLGKDPVLAFIGVDRSADQELGAGCGHDGADFSPGSPVAAADMLSEEDLGLGRERVVRPNPERLVILGADLEPMILDPGKAGIDLELEFGCAAHQIALERAAAAAA